MKSLGLFFTRGVSLKDWVTTGLFDREVAIYHAHIDTGYFSKIYWFTYGNDDKEVAKELHDSGRLSKQIEIVQCPSWFSFLRRGQSALYSLLMPVVVRDSASRCDVFKTNQMEGSLPALICAAAWQRPLYVRTGYTLSRILKETAPRNWLRRGVAYLNEYLAFNKSSAASVSSKYDKIHVEHQYGKKISPRLSVIGNYVDTKLFSPSKLFNQENAQRILYVGRLSPEKNLGNAIMACASIGLGLDIVGSGQSLPQLKDVAQKCGANVHWLGVLPNNQLADLFKTYRYFILPSLWEGLPKALIEAMSAGLVCIGNDTTGINEIIQDGITGYLSPSADADAIASTIRRAMTNDYMAVSLAASQFIYREFSLTVVTTREQEIFTKISTISK